MPAPRAGNVLVPAWDLLLCKLRQVSSALTWPKAGFAQGEGQPESHTSCHPLPPSESGAWFSVCVHFSFGLSIPSQPFLILSLLTWEDSPACLPAGPALLNQILLISLYLFPLMQNLPGSGSASHQCFHQEPEDIGTSLSSSPCAPATPLGGQNPTASLAPEPWEAAPAPPGLRAAPAPGFNNKRLGKGQRHLPGGQRDAG